MYTNIQVSCKCGSGKMPMVRTSHMEFCDDCGNGKIGKFSIGLFLSAICATLINTFQ